MYEKHSLSQKNSQESIGANNLGYNVELYWLLVCTFLRILNNDARLHSQKFHREEKVPLLKNE